MTYELERLAKIQAAAADDRDSIIVGDDVDLYQTEALRFAFYPRVDGGAPVYPALAMLGEIGELDAALEPRDEGVQDERIVGELGDILWYVAAFAQDIGLKLSDAFGSTWSGVIPPRDRLNVYRWALRLGATAGIMSEQCAKKPWRDGTPIDREFAKVSLVGIVQAIEVIADWIDLSLADVAQMNINKLVSRRKRGKLTGSGDNR